MFFMNPVIISGIVILFALFAFASGDGRYRSTKNAKGWLFLLFLGGLLWFAYLHRH